MDRAVPAIESQKLAAQTNSLLIEDMTWTEVRDAIAAGKTTAIYYAGSTEQNGPGMALGKHVFVAHYLAPIIAALLGNALVYPTMPFATTGDWGLVRALFAHPHFCTSVVQPRLARIAERGTRVHR